MYTVTVDRNCSATKACNRVTLRNVYTDNGKGCEEAYPKV